MKNVLIFMIFTSASSAKKQRIVVCHKMNFFALSKH